MHVRAMLKEPLSQKEIAGHDRAAPLKLVFATLVPAEMRLRSWLLRVRNPRDPSYDVRVVWRRGPTGPLSGARPGAHVARTSLDCTWAQKLFVLTTSGSAASA